MSDPLINTMLFVDNSWCCPHCNQTFGHQFEGFRQSHINICKEEMTYGRAFGSANSEYKVLVY